MKRKTSLCCPPPAPEPAAGPLDDARADQELARLAKALGHPVRVKIVRLLGRRQGCICGAIVDELPLAQSTVSQHLKVLRDAGVVRGEVDGPRVCYCLEPRALPRLQALLGALRAERASHPGRALDEAPRSRAPRVRSKPGAERSGRRASSGRAA